MDDCRLPKIVFNWDVDLGYINSCRSYLTQLINGILPLQLEVGRWINKAVEGRLCLICNNGTV